MKEKRDIVKSFGNITLEDLTHFRLEKIKKKLESRIWICNCFSLLLLTSYSLLLCGFIAGLISGIVENQILIYMYVDLLISLILLLLCKITSTVLVIKLKLIVLKTHYKEQTPKILFKYVKNDLINTTTAVVLLISFIIVNILFFTLLR